MFSQTKKQITASTNLPSKTSLLSEHPTKTSNSNPQNCALCLDKQKTLCFPLTIRKALYTKFSSSQNYYYTREINDILLGNRTIKLINYNDMEVLDEEGEYLKRFYCANEHIHKIRILTEYYKYHKDIPRLFMIPITITLNKYLDKKRRMDYVKITKMLKEEQKNEIKNDESFVDSLKESTSEKSCNSFKPEIPRKDNIILQEFYDEKPCLNVSNLTIKEWQAKLKEITTNSIMIEQSKCSYIDIDKNDSISNLKNFLKFMENSEKNEAKMKIKLPLEYKKINLKEDFPILNSNPSNKSAKNFVFERPQLKLNLGKLSLSKKLAILNEKKSNLISLTERSENTKNKITELFFNKKPEIKRVASPDNIKKTSPILKIENYKVEKINKIEVKSKNNDLNKKIEELNTNKMLKIDHNLLNFLMKNLLKQKDNQINLNKNPIRMNSPKNLLNKSSKSKEKILDNTSKLKEKNQIQKKKQGVLSKEHSLASLSLKGNEKSLNKSNSPNQVLINLTKNKKIMHNRIFSNDISKPNPLYFEKKSVDSKNQNVKENIFRSNKANLLRSSYNNFIHGRMNDIQCLTDRNYLTKTKLKENPQINHKEIQCLTERNSLVSMKMKENTQITPKIFHKYTKSEPKLLKKEEISMLNKQNNTARIQKKSGSNKFYTFNNNNNVVNIYVNEKLENERNSIKLKKEEKGKFHLDLHLNLKTE